MARIKIRLSDPRIRLGVDNPQIRLNIRAATVEGGAPYEGAYEVDPNFDEQVLPTREKRMLDDVTVHAILVSKTDNPAGGKTVYIGGIIENA